MCPSITVHFDLNISCKKVIVLFCLKLNNFLQLSSTDDIAQLVKLNHFRGRFIFALKAKSLRHFVLMLLRSLPCL